MRTIRREHETCSNERIITNGVLLKFNKSDMGNNESADVDMTSVTGVIDIEPIHFPQIDILSPDPLHQTDVDFELSVTDYDPPVVLCFN